jgi:ferredoxin-nitrate reductase
VRLRTGVEVRHLDLEAHTAELSDGEVLSYDRLVLATGSRAHLPPIPGIDRAGVHAFRTLDDARRMLAGAAAASRAVVIGGGLLGLEAARGLRERGLRVSVVHLADRLMEQQLDPLGAQCLLRAVRELGIDVHLSARTETLAGDDAVEAVVLADGTRLPADLVVVAAGVQPDVELARAAGLEVGRAITVDDELRTSHPGVWAVGECAQHRDVVYGLWAPLLEQARVAGASLAGVPAGFRGVTPATTLKVAGIDLFCGGSPVADQEDEELVALDSRRGLYRRLVLREGRLAGAVLLGDLAQARPLRELLASGAPVPGPLLELAPVAADAAPALSDDPHTTVCSCMAVSQADIVAAIRDRDLQTVDQISEHTRASTGCGGCRRDVAAVLTAHLRERSEPLVGALGR